MRHCRSAAALSSIVVLGVLPSAAVAAPVATSGLTPPSLPPLPALPALPAPSLPALPLVPATGSTPETPPQPAPDPATPGTPGAAPSPSPSSAAPAAAGTPGPPAGQPAAPAGTTAARLARPHVKVEHGHLRVTTTARRVAGRVVLVVACSGPRTSSCSGRVAGRRIRLRAAHRMKLPVTASRRFRSLRVKVSDAGARPHWCLVRVR